MTRALRSAASKNDAENDPTKITQKKSTAYSKPQRNRKEKILKENKENVTTRRNKNVRQDVVQPLQEKNSVSSVLVAESKKTNRKKSVEDVKHVEENIVPESQTSMVNHPKSSLPSTGAKKPITFSSVTTRKRNQSKDVHTSDSSQAKDAQSLFDHRKSTVAEAPISDSLEKSASGAKTTTMKPLVEFTVKTRSRTKQVEVASHSPMRSSRRQLDKQKPSEMATTTKKPPDDTSKEKQPTISNVTKRQPRSVEGNESQEKQPQISNVTRRQPKASKDDQPEIKQPTISNVARRQPKASKDDQPEIKQPTISNVTRRQRKASKDDQPEIKQPTISNVTRRQRKASKDDQPEIKQPTISNVARRQRKASKDDQPEIKQPTISNVTKRQPKAAKDVKSKEQDSANSTVIKSRRATSKDDSKQEKAVNDLPRNKRSKSVLRVTEEKEMETNSKVQDIDASASPRKKQKTTNTSDPKLDGKVTKQPELLVNRSTASDSSDQSHGSALPIYKRIGNSNNNTVDSVFDFESNSQENTLYNDEEMQEVVAKLVRENRVTIKKKKKGKGVTQSKANVSRAKKIEKIRTDLTKLKTLNAATVAAAKINRKPQTQTSSSYVEKILKTTQDNRSVVDLVDAGSINEASGKQLQNSVFPMDALPSVDIDVMDDVVNDVVHVEDNHSFQKPSNLPKLATTLTETTPRQVLSTYTGPKKANPALYQSTPTRIENSGNSSPWRFNQDEGKYPKNVFSRYTEFEKSPIKSVDITKVGAAPKSPNKKHRLPLATKPISNQMQEIEKPKNLVADLKNGFGFFDDDDDDEDDQCIPPSLPPIGTSIIAFKSPIEVASPKKSTTTATSPKKPKKPLFLGLPQAFNSIRETVQRLRNTQPPPALPDVLKQPKSKTQSTISSHFGDTQPSTSKKNKFTSSKNKFETIKRTKKISETETTTTSYVNTNNYSLFEDSTFPEEKPHRSYSRVTKRDHKRQYEEKSILTDDEDDEFGDTVMQKRTKRSKPHDDKHEQKLKQFFETTNSEFLDIDNFEMVMEKSA